MLLLSLESRYHVPCICQKYFTSLFNKDHSTIFLVFPTAVSQFLNSAQLNKPNILKYPNALPDFKTSQAFYYMHLYLIFCYFMTLILNRWIETCKTVHCLWSFGRCTMEKLCVTKWNKYMYVCFVFSLDVDLVTALYHHFKMDRISNDTISIDESRIVILATHLLHTFKQWHLMYRFCIAFNSSGVHALVKRSTYWYDVDWQILDLIYCP